MSRYDDLFNKLYVQNPIKIVADAEKIKETVNKSRKGVSASKTLFGSEFNEAKMKDLLNPSNEEARAALLDDKIVESILKEGFGKYIKCVKEYYAKSGVEFTPEDLFQGALNEMAKEGKTTPNEKIVRKLAEECGFTNVNQEMLDNAVKVFKANKGVKEGVVVEDESGNINPSLDGEALNPPAPEVAQASADVADNFQSITGINPKDLVTGTELNDQAVADSFNKIVDYLKGKYPDLAQEPAIEEFQNALDGSLRSQYADSFENIPECFSGSNGKKLLEDFGVPGSSTTKSVEGYSVVAKGISDQPTAQQMAQAKGGKVVTDADDPKKWMVVLEESFFSEGTDLNEKALSRRHVNAIGKILRQIPDSSLRGKIGDQFSDLVGQGNPKFKHSRFKDYIHAEDKKLDEQVPADTDDAEKKMTRDTDDVCGECKNPMSECVCKSMKEAKEPIAADISALKNTMGNLYNYYLADDLDQAKEYAQLIIKQAGDVSLNLDKAKATKGAVDQIRGNKIPTASTLHQKIEDNVPGQDTDDMVAQPNAGDLNSMRSQSESKLAEKDGELKFKIKVKAKIPIEGEDIKAKPTTDKEEAGEEAGKAKERAAKDTKKAIKKAEKGSSVEVEESIKECVLVEANIGDQVIYNGNGAKGYQGKKATIVAINDDMAVIKFEDGATYKGAYIAKLQPVSQAPIDGVKQDVGNKRADQLSNKPQAFDQKADDETFDLQKQYALPSKVREHKGLKEYAMAIGISTPQAVGTVGAPEVKNTEDIKDDIKGNKKSKEHEKAPQNNIGATDTKVEAKMKDLLNPNDEKARQELLEDDKEIVELAERCFLSIKLEEKSELTEKEKKFIAETNTIQVDEAKKKAVKNLYRKMFMKSMGK